MACLQLTVFMPVIFLLSMKTGFAGRHTGVCRPFCTGSDCITVNQDRLDFLTAEETCRHGNGELMTIQSVTDENTLDILSKELFGNFWFGLRLPSAVCSNLSAPLRGYEWSSGNAHTSFIPSSITWTDSVEVCSPHCVSLSNDQKWTERLCSDKTDGFLCKTKHKDACRTQDLSEPNVFKSSKGCSDAPCEHICDEVMGGYRCACFTGFIADSKDPRRCKLHCAQQKCPAICEPNDGPCFCPVGFLLSDSFCEDINECQNEGCDQECKNSFGSFVCSCKEGFVLKDQVKCIKAEGSEHLVVTTPLVEGFVKPANNDTLKRSSAPAGGFLWLWIFLIVAVVVFIIAMRFYVKKRREQNSSQQSAAPVANIES